MLCYKGAFQLKNIAAQNMDVVTKLWREQLNPKLEEIGDGWYKTQSSRRFDYPVVFNPTSENNPIWKKLH